MQFCALNAGKIGLAGTRRVLDSLSGACGYSCLEQKPAPRLVSKPVHQVAEPQAALGDGLQEGGSSTTQPSCSITPLLPGHATADGLVAEQRQDVSVLAEHAPWAAV